MVSHFRPVGKPGGLARTSYVDMAAAPDFDRFVQAQESVYPQVVRELRAGRKQTHWMWFIFPQVRGLGYSSMAQTFAIASLDEAKAYLRHPLLGERLRECTALVNGVEDAGVSEIFGYPDDLKFHSSMTLFARAAAEGTGDVFRQALDRFFDGVEDEATVTRL